MSTNERLPGENIAILVQSIWDLLIMVSAGIVTALLVTALIYLALSITNARR